MMTQYFCYARIIESEANLKALCGIQESFQDCEANFTPLNVNWFSELLEIFSSMSSYEFIHLSASIIISKW